MYTKVLLKNNIPVVMISSHEVRSVCIGIWVKAGSRNEEPRRNGISHFIEHMFFKGTGTRTAKEIAMEIDSLGGELNAFTSTENTTFYVKTLDEHIEKSVHLLTDIFLNSSFPESDIEKEKNIITEEIKMVEDTPSDYVHELFNRAVWGDNGLGHAVLGRRDTIAGFTRQDLVNHRDTFYGTGNVVVACAGNFDRDGLVRNLENGIGSLERKGCAAGVSTPEFLSTLNIVPAKLAESHICLGLRGVPYASKERYLMYLLNTILGSGFSSRLFQEIREKRGLAYSAYSYNLSYSDTALWAVYAGTDRENVKEVISVSVDQMRNLPFSITEDELQRAKDQLKGNLILALESTSNRMANLAKQEIYFRRYYSPEEVIQEIDAVTLSRAKMFAQTLTGEKPFALTLYGPCPEREMDEIQRIIS